MKQLNILLIGIFLTSSALGQRVTDTLPGTLWCPNDTFKLHFATHPTLYANCVSSAEKQDWGTDAKPTEYVVIYYGKDSLKLPYKNHLPYAQITFLRFASPKGKTVLRLHFNQVNSFFSNEYIKENSGKVQLDIPEAFELANIIWMLSPSGQRATDLYKSGTYYQQVIDHFKPFLDHPVFKQLNFPDSLYYEKYYDFRENSFAFSFQHLQDGGSGPRLQYNGPYYYVTGDNMADSSLFGKLRPLVEDFAAKSGFHAFYQSHLPFYRKQVERETQLLPMRNMWQWLEEQFPKTTFQSYRVVFSPLIGGSHSTQQYGIFQTGGHFGECVMFICGPDRYDSSKQLQEKQKEGLLSGVVFTEIDHNYINSISSQFRSSIDSSFANHALWAQPDRNNELYKSAESIFNEYMTHAVFCLYIKDTYPPSTADYVIKQRQELMTNKRNFIKFNQFYQALTQLHTLQPELTVAELYPSILKWCKNVQ